MRADPGDPLTPERIVVPHGTVGRWLSLELARELGISANLKFELPAGFAWSVMRGAIPGLPTEQPFAPAQLRWRVHEVLPRFAEEDREGSEVRRYLADGDPRKRFALADRLARTFDRYVVYRPDWIREWSGGDAPHWQARLWRRVVEAEGSTAHWVGAIDAFRAAIESGVRPEGWPLRASFFAVPALSPSYLDVLGGIGRGIDLRLFVLNPCREYWGDIYSRREIGRRAEGADPTERYLTEGNELLAAWGRSGRDTFDSLVGVAGGDGEERFADPPGAHRLAAVQRDVLDLRLASEGCAFEADGVGGGTGGQARRRAVPRGRSRTERERKGSAREGSARGRPARRVGTIHSESTSATRRYAKPRSCTIASSGCSTPTPTLGRPMSSSSPRTSNAMAPRSKRCSGRRPAFRSTWPAGAPPLRPRSAPSSSCSIDAALPTRGGGGARPARRGGGTRARFGIGGVGSSDHPRLGA